MSRPKDLFEACIAGLDSPGAPAAQHHGAPELLRALGYARAPGDEAEPLDEAQLQNRRALLRLASRFDDIFSLPLPHAPGSSFFGALVAPRALGVLGHGPNASGVGGRGITMGGAFESCVGEAAEYLSFIEWDQDDRITGLTEDHGLTPDELTWALTGIGLGSEAPVSRRDWIAASALGDGRRVRFPSELVLRRPAPRRTGTRAAESNGVGAGPTYEDAVRSGLLEAVERDAVGLWWFGGEPARNLSPDVKNASRFRAFLHAVRDDTARRVWFLDLTNDLAVPVIAALSSEPDGAAVIAGFSADPDPRTAAQGALLELCQMELAQQISLYKWREMPEDKLQDMDRVWIERFQSLSLGNSPKLGQSTGGDKLRAAPPGSSIQEITAHLEGMGFTPYAADLTRSEVGIPVARVLVPGLQSAKPDWVSSRLRDAARANGVNTSEIARGPCPI